MYQPTNGKPGVFVLFFVREIWPILRPEKNESAHNLRKKTKKKSQKEEKPGFPFMCTCKSNTLLKLRIKFPEIERDIAEMPFLPFFVENT